MLVKEKKIFNDVTLLQNFNIISKVTQIISVTEPVNYENIP